MEGHQGTQRVQVLPPNYRPYGSIFQNTGFVERSDQTPNTQIYFTTTISAELVDIA